MSIINHIRKHLTNKTVVHLSMLAFAITSTLNIAGFFLATHHSLLVSASIGLALGAGLMAVSIYLSNQDPGHRQNFFMLLAAAIFMALLSGQIQAMGYQLHTLDTFTAYLLGYAPPFVVEILLALSVSLAERSERERVQRDSKRFIKDSVAEAMTTAFRGMDASRIQKHIERQVDNVVRAYCDDAMGEMLADLQRGRKTDAPLPATDARTETAKSQEIAESNKPSVAELNDARQQMVDDRQDAIAQLFATFGQMGITDLQRRLTDDRGIDASERTLRSDLQSMEADGRLTKVSRGRWSVTGSIGATLPTVIEPVLNGKH